MENQFKPNKSYRRWYHPWATQAHRADAFSSEDILEHAMAWMDVAHGANRRGQLTIGPQDRPALVERTARAIAAKRRAAGVRHPVLVWAANPDRFHDEIRAHRLSPRGEFEERVRVPVPPSAADAPEPAPRGWLARWRRLFAPARPQATAVVWPTPPWVPVPDGALALDCPAHAHWNGDPPQAVLRIQWDDFPELVFAGGDLVPPSSSAPDADLGGLPGRFAADWARRHLDLPAGAVLTTPRRQEIERAVLAVHRIMNLPTPALCWHTRPEAYRAAADRQQASGPGPMDTPHQLMQAVCRRSNQDGSHHWTPHQMHIRNLLGEHPGLPAEAATLDARRVAAWRWRTLADPRWRGIALITPDGLPVASLDEDERNALLAALERAAAVAWSAGPGLVNLLVPPDRAD